jgi:large subunit ribosomal protein L24
MLKIKKGDKVKVLMGKDRGREGEVEKVLPKEELVLVPDLNIYKRHVKGGVSGQKSGIYEVPRPFPISKVALICPKCKKQTRVGFKEVDGEKVRICKKCKREIDTK